MNPHLKNNKICAFISTPPKKHPRPLNAPAKFFKKSKSTFVAEKKLEKSKIDRIHQRKNSSYYFHFYVHHLRCLNVETHMKTV